MLVFWDATPRGVTGNYRHFRGNCLSVDDICNSYFNTSAYVWKVLDWIALNLRIHVVFFSVMTLSRTVTCRKYVPSKYLNPNQWLSSLWRGWNPCLLNTIILSFSQPFWRLTDSFSHHITIRPCSDILTYVPDYNMVWTQRPQYYIYLPYKQPMIAYIWYRFFWSVLRLEVNLIRHNRFL
jgi:hypothetical protein